MYEDSEDSTKQLKMTVKSMINRNSLPSCFYVATCAQDVMNKKGRRTLSFRSSFIKIKCRLNCLIKF